MMLNEIVEFEVKNEYKKDSYLLVESVVRTLTDVYELLTAKKYQ